LRDMIDKGEYKDHLGRKIDWQAKLAAGMSIAVTSAVNVVAGLPDSLADTDCKKSDAARAKEWFINSYPLLGGVPSETLQGRV